MSQREPLASGGVTELAPPPASDREQAARTQHLPDRSWEEMFRGIGPDRQHELLALARRQGILYAHQLPKNGNGHAAPVQANPHRLLNLLSGKTSDLDPIVPTAVELCDTALDEVQREAVARALATPDVFLLQGLPGTGQSRVLAEIIMQAALRGERVLLLAPTTPPLDRILEGIGQRDILCPVRCLGADDASLPPAIRGLTFAERLKQLGEGPLQRARQDIHELEERCRRHQRHESILAQLRELARRGRELDEKVARLQQPSAGASDDLSGRFEQRGRDLAELQPRRDDIRDLLACKGRWWTPTWWRGLLRGNLAAELATLEATAQQIRADLDAITLERSRRIDAALAALLQDKRVNEDAWRRSCEELDADSSRPLVMRLEAVDESQTLGRQQAQKDEEQLTFARQWLTCLQESASTLPARLVRYANLVAATTLALPEDPQFGDAAEPASKFDLLILQDADQVTRAEFLRLAARAQRWILVGDTEMTTARPQAGSIAALRTGFLGELWQAVHCDPRTLQCEWIQEKHRLHCRLRPISAEQRSWLECERVADFPEVELRILSLPRTKPVLAEVVFPASMSIAQAKSYIFQELQELPVCASGSSLRWSDDAERTVLHLGPVSGEITRVCLEPGVHEVTARTVVGSNGAQTSVWTTARIEFEHKAGWQRARAVEWTGRHLALRDLGRSARLDVPQRMQPDLATFVADVLFPGGYRIDAVRQGAAAPCVEFIGVGAKAESNGKHNGKRAPQRSSLPKAGAGLELDLSDRRHRDRLPNELRPDLPEHGLVNYLEAHAVVRYLEGLVADPEARKTFCATPADVAVIALYPAQAELLRHLVQQSATLATASFKPVIDVPSAFKEREAALVLVSLTRSHAHRAVTFGESPRGLALALTRARCKLVLFGDPGTLARRCQWTGAVDHLDEATSLQERDTIARLARYLEGQGAHPHTFLLREGGGA